VTSAEWKADGKTPPGQVKEFVVAEAPPAEVWTKAARVTLDAPARDAILKVVGDLAAAIAGKDLEAACRLLDFRTVDVGRSVYMAPEKARASQKEFLSGLMESRTWALDPVDPATVTLAPVAEGSLVATSLKGKAVIRVAMDDDAVFSLPVYMAQVGGAWVVAR
jgi:hypothetical protein